MAWGSTSFHSSVKLLDDIRGQKSHLSPLQSPKNESCLPKKILARVKCVYLFMSFLSCLTHHSCHLIGCSKSLWAFVLHIDVFFHSWMGFQKARLVIVLFNIQQIWMVGMLYETFKEMDIYPKHVGLCFWASIMWQICARHWAMDMDIIISLWPTRQAKGAHYTKTQICSIGKES